MRQAKSLIQRIGHIIGIIGMLMCIPGAILAFLSVVLGIAGPSGEVSLPQEIYDWVQIPQWMVIGGFPLMWIGFWLEKH